MWLLSARLTFGVAAAAAPTAADRPSAAVVLSPIRSTLSAIDLAFLGVGLATALTMVTWYLVKREDPLRDAPVRASRFREESVAVPMGTYLCAALLLAALVAASPLESSGIVASLVIGGGAQIVGTAACLAVAARQYAGGVRALLVGGGSILRRRHWTMVTLLSVVGIGVCPAVSALTVMIIEQAAPGFELPLHPTLKALQQNPPLALTAGLWIAAMIVAPLAEELFFRGVMQTTMVRMLGSRWAAITLSALAFALVHYQQPHAVAALFVLGVILGFAYERSGALVTPFVVHVAFNTKTLIGEALQ